MAQKIYSLAKNDPTLRLKIFEERIDKNGPLLIDTPCWNWVGGIVPSTDYGRYGKKGLLAHILSYKFYVSAEIEKGMCLCSC